MELRAVHKIIRKPGKNVETVEPGQTFAADADEAADLIARGAAVAVAEAPAPTKKAAPAKKAAPRKAEAPAPSENAEGDDDEDMLG